MTRQTAKTPAPLVRRATSEDCESIARIYNEGIAERRSTFEMNERSAAEISRWLSSPEYPVLVVENASCDVLGWARISAYSARPCYSRVGEASVYVSASARGQGLGSALADELQTAAEEAGFQKLVGKLIAKNTASLALAARHGFREVGLHLRHGKLDGQWHDVLIIELLLGDITI